MPHLKSISGINWHYEIQGQGDALLFLHGWSVNSRIWRQQLKHFSEHYQIIALDLPGHGKSSWQTITLHDIAEDVHFLLTSLGIKSIGIIASSLGGLVALKLFELYPQQIRFFVFAGSQPKFSRTQDYPYGLDMERIRKLAGQLDSDYPSIVNVFFRSLFTRHERESRRFKWIQTFRRFEGAADKQALLALLDVLEQEDLRPIFYRVDRPILFVNGTEDSICNKSFYEGLDGQLSQAQLHWFERCGHFPFLSQPQEFNQVVHDFIQQLQKTECATT